MKSITFQILGNDWTLNSMSFKQFANKHGDNWDAQAITDADLKEIDLIPRGLTRATIIHELVHAYLHEMCMGSVDFDDDNLEEVFAELMSYRGEEILTLSTNLLKRIKKGSKK